MNTDGVLGGPITQAPYRRSSRLCRLIIGEPKAQLTKLPVVEPRVWYSWCPCLLTDASVWSSGQPCLGPLPVNHVTLIDIPLNVWFSR